jgi:hypothetical protein
MLIFDTKIKNVTLEFTVVLKKKKNIRKRTIKNKNRKIIAVIQKIKPYDWSKIMMNEIIIVKNNSNGRCHRKKDYGIFTK